MERELILTTKKQLIDINQEKTNFDITILVKAKNPEHTFEGVIVSQTDLDKNPELDYKVFSGEMSARVTHNKNIYQNHFLCLRAPKGNVPVLCKFVTHQEPRPEIPPPISNFNDVLPPKREIKKKPVNLFSTKNILIFIAVVGIGIGLYFLWTNKPQTADMQSSAKSATSKVSNSGSQKSTNSFKSPVLAKAQPILDKKGPIVSPNLLSRLQKIVN